MSDQAEASHSAPVPAPPIPGGDGEQHLKSLAKHLARSATAAIDDRRVRASVRATCYNHTLTLLRQVDERWRADRQRLRRRLTVTTAAALTTALALAGVLLV